MTPFLLLCCLPPVAASALSQGAARRLLAWGPDNLEEVCEQGICHRFGKISAPVDHDDPSQGEWDLVYFVNSDFWDPIEKPNGPVFVNMGYGSTGVGGYTSSALRQVDDATFSRGFVGTNADFAKEIGALVINVPNRYYGCETARAGRNEGSCPTSLEEIPEGEEGVIEALERLRFLSLKSVVDDIAFVAKATITTFAEDWGMTILPGSERASNQPIVFGCSWPGAAAVYSRMLHPEVFAGAVATSHPLVSSPAGNNHYRSFVGSVYELYSAGGSLECRNIISVGHEEIRRRIEEDGEDNGPIGSCVLDCAISEAVNADFGRGPDQYYSFGGGIPGLPGVQTIDRECTVLGCNIETTCGFLRECVDSAIDPSFDDPFPISAAEPHQAEAAYQCLASFSAAVQNMGSHNDTYKHRWQQQQQQQGEEPLDERDLMVFNPDSFEPNYNLGPLVYQSNTLTYKMFGFEGPLWMTQTCNLGSGCPFVQGKAGGASLAQINARLWTSYTRPGVSLAEFIEGMRIGARDWRTMMGGQRPWSVEWAELTNVYMVYNDADPWTGTGADQAMPEDRNLSYDLGGGGVSHCVFPAPAAQAAIKEWANTPVNYK